MKCKGTQQCSPLSLKGRQLLLFATLNKEAVENKPTFKEKNWLQGEDLFLYVVRVDLHLEETQKQPGVVSIESALFCI